MWMILLGTDDIIYIIIADYWSYIPTYFVPIRYLFESISLQCIYVWTVSTYIAYNGLVNYWCHRVRCIVVFEIINETLMLSVNMYTIAIVMYPFSEDDAQHA